MEDAPVTIRGRCGEGETESSVPGLQVVVEGESGRNELLRGPFALFGVRNSAKLVRNLAKHRRTPMSPPQLIPPISPVQVFSGDGRLRRRFPHTGPGPLRSLIVSSLKGGRNLCHCHYISPYPTHMESLSGHVLRRLYLLRSPNSRQLSLRTKDS